MAVTSRFSNPHLYFLLYSLKFVYSYIANKLLAPSQILFLISLKTITNSLRKSKTRYMFGNNTQLRWNEELY